MTTSPSVAYVKWYEEEIDDGSGHRRVPAASIVRDVTAFGGEHQEVLAYLGSRPAVTPALIEELTSLYPDVTFDWDALRHDVEQEASVTDVAGLTDDEMARQLRGLAREQGLSLTDLSLRLGNRHRDILPELLRLIEDPAAVARFERTSGSVFTYLAERHPDYAFLLYKARLFFSGQEALLAGVIDAEPPGFGAAAWRARRQFWRLHLDAYRDSRPSPLYGPDEST